MTTMFLAAIEAGVAEWNAGLTCCIRHLTSASEKGRGMESSRRPMSCSQYSNTMNTLHPENTALRPKSRDLHYRPEAHTTHRGVSTFTREHKSASNGGRMGQAPSQKRVGSMKLLGWGWGGSGLGRNDLSGLLPVTTFLRATMLGWPHDCSTLSSRIAVSGTPAHQA